MRDVVPAIQDVDSMMYCDDDGDLGTRIVMDHTGIATPLVSIAQHREVSWFVVAILVEGVPMLLWCRSRTSVVRVSSNNSVVIDKVVCWDHKGTASDRESNPVHGSSLIAVSITGSGGLLSRDVSRIYPGLCSCKLGNGVVKLLQILIEFCKGIHSGKVLGIRLHDTYTEL
ncbi:hypothetical protein G9A89_000332 [Geosiphon pyriformis]|nr:hypothetical protein G9A89_000332 [Geosiphon pyriformis]